MKNLRSVSFFFLIISIFCCNGLSAQYKMDSLTVGDFEKLEEEFDQWLEDHEEESEMWGKMAEESEKSEN